jgi:TctA family transporter
MKGLNPGPTLFTQNAPSMYALYIIFILANLLMIPLGLLTIRAASTVLRARARPCCPLVIVCAAVGAFATGNNLFSVLVVAASGSSASSWSETATRWRRSCSASSWGRWSSRVS